MLPTHWNPRTEMRRYRDPMERFFDSFLGGELSRPREEISNRRWMPPVDIRETEDTYEVHAELPGMKKDDIGITLENNALTLSGERRFEKETDRDNYHRVERMYGDFSRTFTLPTAVDPDRIEAHFEDGILKVEIPKREEARPRRIAIQ